MVLANPNHQYVPQQKGSQTEGDILLCLSAKDHVTVHHQSHPLITLACREKVDQ